MSVMKQASALDAMTGRDEYGRTPDEAMKELALERLQEA
jgi:hypothetical protein